MKSSESTPEKVAKMLKRLPYHFIIAFDVTRDKKGGDDYEIAVSMNGRGGEISNAVLGAIQKSEDAESVVMKASTQHAMEDVKDMIDTLKKGVVSSQSARKVKKPVKKIKKK